MLPSSSITPYPWIATYDNDPLVKDIYKWATIETERYRYSISGSGRKSWKRANELLLRNPERPPLQPQGLGIFADNHPVTASSGD